MGKNIKKNISEVIGILLSLVILVPLYMLIINSFKDKAGAAEMNLSIPDKWRIIENYLEVIKVGGTFIAFRNSLIVSCISVTTLVILSAMAGFVIQRRKQKIIGIIYFIITLGLFIPVSIVPTYFIVKFLLLNKSFLGVSLVYIAVMFPMGVFLYTGFYKGIPLQIDESAIIDGSGILRLFFTIIFPLVKPVTVTVVIVVFMSVWNDFGAALYFLSTPQKYTMVLTLFYFFGQRAADWNLVFADVVMVSLPVIILYFVLQKYIVSGMTAGAVKG